MSADDPAALFSRQLEEHLAVARAIDGVLPVLDQVARVVIDRLEQGARLYAFGNGGSATQAQHLTGELIGRYAKERRPLPAVALTADSAAVTCIGNDYAFEDVFARQVHGLAREGDLVIGLTTSGRSKNVIRGLAAARERKAIGIALTGRHLDALAPVAEHVLSVPSDSTARIQEMHLFFIHLLCEQIDAWAVGDSGR